MIIPAVVQFIERNVNTSCHMIFMQEPKKGNKKNKKTKLGILWLDIPQYP